MRAILGRALLPFACVDGKDAVRVDVEGTLPGRWRALCDTAAGILAGATRTSECDGLAERRARWLEGGETRRTRVGRCTGVHGGAAGREEAEEGDGAGSRTRDGSFEARSHLDRDDLVFGSVLVTTAGLEGKRIAGRASWHD